MKTYSTEDLGMWGSWLVCGTSLGVGSKVVEAMKTFDVKFEVAPVVASAHTHFYPLIIATSQVSSGGGGGAPEAGDPMAVAVGEDTLEAEEATEVTAAEDALKQFAHTYEKDDNSSVSGRSYLQHERAQPDFSPTTSIFYVRA